MGTDIVETVMRVSTPFGVLMLFGVFSCAVLPAPSSVAAQETPPPTPAPAPPPPAEPKAAAPNAAAVPSEAGDILKDPEIQKQLEGKTPEEAKVWGVQMLAKGLKRLPYNDLVTWNDIRAKLAASSPAVCSGFWKGGVDGAQMQKALASLSKEDQDRWTVLSTRAIALEAKNAPYPPSAPDDVPQVMKFVMSQLSETDRARFQTLASKGAGITDEEACWLMTSTLQAVGRDGGDQAVRERSIRTLAALGSPK